MLDIKTDLTVVCPSGCGCVRPMIENGRFRCPVCGEDLTNQVKEIDPDLVELIAHSSIRSVFEEGKERKRRLK